MDKSRQVFHIKIQINLGGCYGLNEELKRVGFKWNKIGK